MRRFDVLAQGKFLLVAVLLMACASAKRGERSTGVVRVEPADASPGMTVRLIASEPVFVEPLPAVMIGKRATLVQRVLSPTEAFVLVPNIAPGMVEVEIVAGAKTAGGSVRLEVTPAATRRVVLEISDGNVRVLRTAPCGGEFTSTVENGQARLSFDVLTPEGNLVFAGAIVDPTEGRMELFDQPTPSARVLRQEPPGASAVFELKVPNLERETVIRFYRAAAGTDLKALEGRAARRFVAEIRFKP